MTCSFIRDSRVCTGLIAATWFHAQLAQKNPEWYLEQVGHTIIHPRLIGEHISDESMPLKHRETHNSIRKRASLTQK